VFIVNGELHKRAAITIKQFYKTKSYNSQQNIIFWKLIFLSMLAVDCRATYKRSHMPHDTENRHTDMKHIITH